MGYGVGKKDNEYARELLRIEAPKTVWMAIALSFAMQIRGSEDTRKAADLCFFEWQALNENGIVPQKPRRRS